EHPRLCMRHTGGRVACVTCEDRVRNDLLDLAGLVEALPEQAVEGASARGTLLAAAPIPGGDAMVLLGPWADHEQRDHIIASVEAGRVDFDMDDDSIETPAECLA